MNKKTLLKVYFPYKNDASRMLPIEIDIISLQDFDKAVANFKNNFVMFVAKLFEQNPELEIETDIEKCKFEKISIEEFDINQY